MEAIDDSAKKNAQKVGLQGTLVELNISAPSSRPHPFCHKDLNCLVNVCYVVQSISLNDLPHQLYSELCIQILLASHR